MSREYYKEALAVKERLKWDCKEWARHTGLPQRALEAIDAGTFPDDKETKDALTKLTDEGRFKNLHSMLRFKRPMVIASGVHKGGAGKTTLAIGLADALADSGYNVLVIDGDAQMDATDVLRPKPDAANTQEALDKQIEENNIFTALATSCDIRKVIVPTGYKNLDLVAASRKLTSAEPMLMTQSMQNQRVEMIFHDILEPLMEENYYDFVFVDMDKNEGFLNRAFLAGCRYLLIPSECTSFNVKGVADMKGQCDAIVSRTNPDLELLGIVLQRVVKRKSIVGATQKAYDTAFPGLCFQNSIRMDANVEKAQWDNVPLRVYNKSCNAWKDMLAVKDELIERVRASKV